MLVDIKIPSPGESISEVEIGNWFIEEGGYIEKDQEIGEIESDKATLPLIAEASGTVNFKAEPGDSIKVGEVACVIDTEGKGEAKPQSSGSEKPTETQEAPKTQAARKTAKAPKEPTAAADEAHKNVKVSPLAKQVMQEHNLSLNDVLKGIERISKSTVEAVAGLPKENSANVSNNQTANSAFKNTAASRDENKERMSQLRRKIAKRLVAVKNETAMLTTFNEVDMSNVMALRKAYQKKFTEKHGVKLGFMSFFTKAASVALQEFPKVNSMIDGDEMITPEYNDIGIAVQTDKGLMVPVLRNVETMGLAEIEKAIIDKATLARKGRLPLEDMSGGTFTITNGGIFGSMLSTPIINPPQSGILGMHNIVERPVAVKGNVEIRPIMYLALSYDHRIIDGRDSVSFLKKVKELIENPTQMLLGTASPESMLLEI